MPAALLFAALCFAVGAPAAFGDPPFPPHGDGLHKGGGNDHLDNSSHGYYPGTPPPDNPPPDNPPPDNPPPQVTPTDTGSGAVAGATASSGGFSGVAGVKTSGHAPTFHPAPTVTVAPQPAPPKIAPVKHHAKPVHTPKPIALPALPPAPVPAVAATDSRRSIFANHLLSPTGVDLSAKNLGEGGLLAILLIALLYLPVTIFNKTTEKNDATIHRWLERPRAAMAFLFGWIPLRNHAVWTLVVGVLLSAFLFSFIEPGFPTENGALEYGIGMALGFGLVSTTFFTTWRYVIHRLEPDSEGHWRIYPPFIFLAAFLVLMARLAHFIPGVVLGTVAEYEPGKKLSTRTAGIRVATTYGALMILGLAAWFAWIPVEHAAQSPHASSLTLVLDAALAITFVSSLESVAFGLVPMTFLDGNDLWSWNKGLWAAMWGSAVLWFSIVILHPALSTYGHQVSGNRAIWFALLFSALMLVAVITWGFFRVREAREARQAHTSA